MPAAADKLVREIELFGENFERYQPDDDAQGATGAAGAPTRAKVAAKSTGLKYQFQIMETMDIPREEIKKFADPYYWLKYYPPICMVRTCVLDDTTHS